MSSSTVVIVRTGVANLASVMAAFRRLGFEPQLSEKAEEIRHAERVMLPGVGAFGAAMEQLRHHGLVEVLQERFAENRPTVAICVGLQVLGTKSEESPGAQGLGILPVEVRRFPATVRVPHFGWNEVKVSGPARILQSGFAYFANSYHLASAPEGWTVATAEHGVPFPAALERGNCIALQFHPELSGPFGEGILRRWLEQGGV